MNLDDYEAELDRARARMRRQARVLGRADAEAARRGIDVAGVRPSYVMRLCAQGDADVAAILADVHEANAERERLAAGVQERMEQLREYEDMTVLIDRARGLGGRGW